MPLTRRDFLASMPAVAGFVALPASATNTAGTFQQVFDNPPDQARPWVRWWWPGGVVEDGELRREIQILRQTGFGGAEIQAFNPAIPNLTKAERLQVNDYANSTYFAHVKTCTDAAQEQNLQIDVTFGSAWPSGGGFAITPELALLELTPAVTSVRAPVTGPIRLKVPPNTRKFGAMSALDARTKDPRAVDWRARIEARQKVVAVVAFKGNAPVLEKNKNYRSAIVKSSGTMEPGTSVVLTDRLGADGALDWVPPGEGDWQIVVFKQFVVDSGVMAGVGEGPQLVLDHFRRAAFEAHARRVGEPMVADGARARALRGTFIDSLELMPDIYWSEDLITEFKARRGYDLTPHFPHLLQPGWMESWNPHASAPYFDAGEAGDRIRADYRLTISELLIENFWRPFAEWNHRHGLSARVQAHGGPGDLLQSYGLGDIPETEDLESAGDTHFMRLARAAADLYGKKLVGCESLCWAKRSFDVTPGEWQARVNLLLASGVNAIVMHGFPYALHRDAWPGWYPFAPSPFLEGFSSMINEANPLWGAMGKLNGYIARLQALLQRGRNVVSVAVYLGEIGYYHDIEPKATHTLLHELLRGGYDYDRINDDCIGKGRIERGMLVAPGGARYRALILPPRASLRASTAAQVARLAKQGLPVFYADRPPSRDEGYFEHEARDRLVRQAIQDTLDHGARIAAADTMPAALRQAGIAPNLTFTSEPCMFVEKTLDDRTAYFFHNPKDEAVTVRFVSRAAGHPESWNAFDGSRTGLKTAQVAGRREVSVDIGPGGGAFVVFAARRMPPAPAWTTVDTIDLSQRSWQLGLIGHGSKGRKIERELSLSRLDDLGTLDGLADFSGQASYAAELTLPDNWLRDGYRIRLDLGAVHDMATVAVDGRLVDTLIARPFDADLTKHLPPGARRLTITVSNSPNNAMMDPKLPGLKNLKPKPAGLLGPVKLLLEQKKAAA